MANVLQAADLPLMNTPTVMSGTTPAGAAFSLPAGTNLLKFSFNNATQGPELNGLGYYAPSGLNSKNPSCAGWKTCWTTGWRWRSFSLTCFRLSVPSHRLDSAQQCQRW